MLLDKYGHDSDVARVRIFGDFPRAEADAFIPLEIVELAVNSDYKHSEQTTIGDLGVDVARFGDDETAIVKRIDNYVFPIKTYRKKDTTETTGYVLKAAREMMQQNKHLKQIYIKVDDSGVGGGVTDQLREKIREQRLPYKVYPVINNGKANDDEHYENVGTEQWAVLRDILNENFSKHMQGEPVEIHLPDDEKLVSQLTTRKYRMTSRGKIALERKEEMKDRGLQSPDRADAIVLAFYRPKDKIRILM
mgnify:CR=1 FL=1